MEKSRIDFRTHPPSDFDLELFAEEHRENLNVNWVIEELRAIRRGYDFLWDRVRSFEERDEVGVEL